MYERILVPIDGSEPSNRGLQEAIRLAKLSGGRLKLMHVIDTLSMSTVGEAYLGPAGDLQAMARKGAAEVLEAGSSTAAEAGVRVETELFEHSAGRVAELVAEQAAAWGAGIVVLGTHGRRGVGRLLLGSDAEHIARLSPVPVLLVRDKAAAVG